MLKVGSYNHILSRHLSLIACTSWFGRANCFLKYVLNLKPSQCYYHKTIVLDLCRLATSVITVLTLYTFTNVTPFNHHTFPHTLYPTHLTPPLHFTPFNYHAFPHTLYPMHLTPPLHFTPFTFNHHTFPHSLYSTHLTPPLVTLHTSCYLVLCST